MERPIDRELEHLCRDLVRMGRIAEGMVRDAMRSLLENDVDLAQRTIRGDVELDLLEKNLDEATHSVLVRFHPTASDLRTLIAVMKMVVDFERIGDAAVNISQAVEVLARVPPLKPYIDLPKMADLARSRVRASLEAFAASDVAKALEVLRGDDEIDRLYEQLFRELVVYMFESSANVERALHLLLIARNLERIADHATNIAEDVIYRVEGLDLRHSDAAREGRPAVPEAD